MKRRRVKKAFKKLAEDRPLTRREWVAVLNKMSPTVRCLTPFARSVSMAAMTSTAQLRRILQAFRDRP